MKTVAHRMLIGTLCLWAGSAPLAAQSRLGQRFPLSAEAVTRALHKDGLDVHAEDVRLPMPLSTTVSDPALEVVGADRLPDGHLRLRLRCQHAGDCVAFSVTLTHSVAAPLVLAALAQPGAETTAADGMTQGTSQPSTTPVSVAAEPVSVRAGTRLTMLLEDGHMHIHLPVISLDSSTGDREIHVATPDHKHTYRATVVNATTVRGIME